MPEHQAILDCKLQENRLNIIEGKLDDILDDMKKLLGYSGPLVDLNSRVRVVEESERTSSARIKTIEGELKAESGRLNRLAVIIGTISGTLGAGAATLLNRLVG